jgi:putative addiction module killer protein
VDDRLARARIQARIDRLSLGNAGDWRPVHGPVAEMRIHHGPGYRVYFMRAGLRIVILLAGGTKSGQSRDIRRALEMANEIEEG